MSQKLFISGNRFVAGQLDTNNRYLFKVGNLYQFYLPIGQTIGINNYGLFRYSVGPSIWQTSDANHPVTFDANYQPWGIGGITNAINVPPAPVVSNISLNTQQGVAVAIDLSTVTTGSFNTFNITSPPGYGTISWTNQALGQLTYTATSASPNNGIDHFSFQAIGDGGASNTAQANLTWVAPASSFGANDANVSVASNTMTIFGVPAYGTWDSVTIVTPPSKGTATVFSSTSFSYSPNSGVTGTTDSFTYKVTSNGVDSNIATVTLYIDLPTP